MTPLRPRFTIQKSRIRGLVNDSHFEPDQVIYAEIDDEITHVFDRVKRAKGKNVALVIPKRAVILQSIINLRILKKKLDELGRTMLIVTTDTAGLVFAEKAGFLATERLMEKEVRTEALNPLPLRTHQRPVRRASEKISLSEVIHQDRPTVFQSLSKRLHEFWRKKKQSAAGTRVRFVAPNKQALFTLVLVSVLLLLAIAYIALPGATVYLTPKSSILDPSFNVTFLDVAKNPSFFEDQSYNSLVIKSYRIEPPPLTKKILHPATGKVSRGERAAGQITVTNLSTAPWELAPQTRFQTENGLVFRTPVAIRIPAATARGSGKLDVSVVADEFDAHDQITGERGNIGPSKFFLPGIKNPENQKKLFGESKQPMLGGITQVVKSVTEEDLRAAEEKTKKTVEREAEDDLKKYLEQQNLLNKTNLSLLTDRHVVTVSGLNITIPENLLGKASDQFEVTANYRVEGLAYDREELISALKERLTARVDPDKKLLKISEDDVSYKFLDQDTGAGKVRLTATMRAVQAYQLNPEQENGHRFLKKITDHILGLRVNEATEYLQQQTDEIASVEITTWPIWAPTIPTIADNVKFVIQEEENSLR